MTRRFRLRDVLVARSTGDPEGKINFITVSPSQGPIPSGVMLALNPDVVSYMAPGRYSLLVRFENAEAPESIPGGTFVSLTVFDWEPAAISRVVHAASLEPAISPGQVVTIFGENLSTPPIEGKPDTAGLYPTTLGNTRVWFNDIAAPLLYVSPTQINCVAPQALAGASNADVVIERVLAFNAVTTPRRSPPFPVELRPLAPGIYTDGSGRAAIVAPVDAERRRLTFLATGVGPWKLPYPDGAIVLSESVPFDRVTTYVAPSAPVSVTVGGVPVAIVQASARRGQVYGTLHVTIEVPKSLEPGEYPLVLQVGEANNSEQQVRIVVP